MIGQILNNPHFRPLEEKLRLHFGDDEAQRLTAAIHDRLRSLLTLHTNDAEDLKDESHGYILPSIAIYQTLQEKVGREGALLIFREIYFVAAHQAATSIGQKAEDATYRRQFLQMMIANKHGERAGFEYRTIENTTTAVEFHVLRCPYVTYCQHYGCPELTPVFCECDDVFYGHIHPLLRWERTKTLGRGHELCNFRFRLKENNEMKDRP